MATIDTFPDTSFLRIIRDLRDDVTALFRQEVALAKRELAGKAMSIGKNTVYLGIGAVVGLYALFFVFFFLNNLLASGMIAIGLSDHVAAWFAPLLFGMLLGIAALLLSLKSLKAMRKEKAVPRATLDSIREDKDWIRTKVKG
jgi:hypothetical protein